jgi:SAM-dependent methyltransferase
MTSTAAPPRDAYERLAPLYDAFTAASDYELWTDHVLGLAASHGWAGRTVLDVACGTGKSLVPFANRGYETVGTDASRAMLAVAARKLPGVRLVEADMRRLPALGRFDLVTCFDDSLNHLLDEAGLVAALAAMAANLAPVGLLVFDLNTLLAYRTTFAGDSVSGDDDLTFVWRGDSTPDAEPGCSASARIDALRRRPDGLYERTTTVHEQRHFIPARVEELLAAAGLDCLGIHGVLADGSPVDPLDESCQLKAIFVARLAKGGELRDDQAD